MAYNRSSLLKIANNKLNQTFRNLENNSTLSVLNDLTTTINTKHPVLFENVPIVLSSQTIIEQQRQNNSKIIDENLLVQSNHSVKTPWTFSLETLNSFSDPSTTMAPVAESSYSSLGSITTEFINTLLGVGVNKNDDRSASFLPTTTATTIKNYSYSTKSYPEVFILDSSSEIKEDSTTEDQSSTDVFYIFNDPLCYSSPESYELITSVICSSLLVFGIVYLTYGYRCFRAMNFFIGLTFTAALTFAIITVERLQLTPILYGDFYIALMVGFLFGLITMLVTYIGLFIIGLHLGLMMGCAMFIVIFLLRPYFLVLQPPLAAPTLLIFFVAFTLFGALTTVYFSKGCSIISSSMYGSALTLLSIDYFLENFKVVHWFFDTISNGDDWYGLLANIKRGSTLCFGSHVILLLWPALSLLGMIVQGCLTAKGLKHRGGYGMVDQHKLTINHSAEENLIKCPSNSSLRSKNLEEVRLEQKHRKYRYLYQVRTRNGDMISQHYLQSLQNKKFCFPDQHDTFTFNSDLSSHFLPSESRTTTLSVA